MNSLNTMLSQKMTKEQNELFGRLKRDREDSAKTLEKTSMKGVKQSVTDKYSEQAHFIYELLQNADDAEATQCRFVLNNDRLIFSHNGRIHFSISDPDSQKEECAKIEGNLGHINSITSIANSTKSEADIGKFGLGFKSVFQYTNTPHVYDPPFIFKIDRFIVPVLLEKDHPERKPEETLFYFPFAGVRGKTSETAYKEIADRLEGLDNPLLFLRHLKEIGWNVGKKSGCYLKEEERQSDHRIVSLMTEVKDKGVDNRFLIFDRNILNQDRAEEYKISIAYPCTVDKALKFSYGHKYPAYCFFATRETTELRFIINAPFKLTDNRENIKQRHDWNISLRDQLAKLVVDSLPIIKAQGLLTTDYLALLPNDSDELIDFYKPFQDSVVQTMKNKPLVPTHDKKYARADELLDGPRELKGFLNKDDIAFLADKQATWAIGIFQNPRAVQFLKTLGIEWWGWYELVEAVENRFDPQCADDINNNLNWLSSDDEWTQSLYALLDTAIKEEREDWDPADCCIVRIQSGKYRSGKEVYFPHQGIGSDIDGLERVKETILQGKKKKQIEQARSFLIKAGVKEAGEREEIELILKTYYATGTKDPTEKRHLRDINRFIDWWLKEKDETVFEDYFVFRDDTNEESYRSPKDMYLDKPYLDTGLSALFKNSDEEKNGLWDGYLKAKNRNFVDFAKAVGVTHSLKIEGCDTHNNPCRKILRQDYSKHNVKWTTSAIDKDYTINNIGKYLQLKNKDISWLIWKTLSSASPEVLRAKFRPNQQYSIRYEPSILVHHLKSHEWIPDKKGNFSNPEDISKEMLPADFLYDDSNGWLTAICFGENAKKQQENYKQKQEWAKHPKIDIAYIQSSPLTPYRVFKKID
ncbi:MAG: hypothetical protein Q7T53_02005 [Deltaproteobacteria bacterium]|nr:hypothetical protein [Deltaproteobacteria bacterium]